jgi:isoquinoline 1-oxidoreductase alpha subunit
MFGHFVRYVMARVKLTVNGRAQTIDVDPEMPLLWVLRDELNLVGTKFGCGAGVCGACTVLINGAGTRSCQTQVASVAGKRITTIEGLAREGLELVQRAWMEIDVPQCGYCQAGQIMTATALLARTPDPSDEEIARAMSANLCRCGTYLRVRQAVRRAVELKGDKRS